MIDYKQNQYFSIQKNYIKLDSQIVFREFLNEKCLSIFEDKLIYSSLLK